MQNKHRVLAFHGWLQTADKFRSKTGAFRKKLKNLEMDAPILTYPPDKINDGTDAQTYRSWLKFDSATNTYEDYYTSLKYVIDHCENNGPYDGVLGFSQGCTIVQGLLKLSELQHLQMSEHPFAQKMAQITGTTIWFTKQTPFKFAFLCGGFPPNDIELKYFLSEKSHSITTPSCHIIGDADTIIPKERSLQMLDFFEDLPTRVIVTHTGGHGLPHDGETTSAVKKFLTTL